MQLKASAGRHDGKLSTFAARGVARLKVLLTIPVAVYYQLLSLCELSSLEYAILKNAVVRDIDDDDESVVNLFCDSERARTLLAWAPRSILLPHLR